MIKSLSFLLFPLSLFSQNFIAADNIALNTPPGKTTTINSLAEYLCAEQPDDAHKARAIYAWVTFNIAYVDSTGGEGRWATSDYTIRQSPQRVLQNRTAVCLGYANLFCALMNEAGLPCEVVSGLVKNADDEIAEIGHAWATARIQGEWRLFDPTWGKSPPGVSEMKVQEKYFMASPADFVLKHLPDDPMWQLLENPLTERQFRVSFDQEILDLVRDEYEGGFKFRDTLNHWFAMDPKEQIFAAERRVLRFNGSNERAIIGLGQRYWSLFFDLQIGLDTLVEAAILTSNQEMDTVWLEAQVKLLERYQLSIKSLFDRFEKYDLFKKAAHFHSPDEVAALIQKMRGDIRMGVYQHLYQSRPEAVLNANQIAAFRYQINLAKLSYHSAEHAMDCVKMAKHCLKIWHNRSFMAIQLAQDYIRLAQLLANDSSAVRNVENIALNLREARAFLIQALDDCERMRSQPLKFAFVEERQVTARQWLWKLRSCEIQARRAVLTPEIEKMLTSRKLPARSAKNLVEKMSAIVQSMNGLKDSVQNLEPELGIEFVQTTLYNLQLENFSLQFNLSNLLYRIALNDYEIAIANNSLAKQKSNIQSTANRALQTLKQVTSSLEYVEKTERLPANSIVQKRTLVNKLSKSIKGFLADL